MSQLLDIMSKFETYRKAGDKRLGLVTQLIRCLFDENYYGPYGTVSWMRGRSRSDVVVETLT